MLLIYAPDRMRGRLQGVNTVVVAGGPRLGDLRAGATAGLGGGDRLLGRRWASRRPGWPCCSASRFPALLRYRPAPVGDR